LHLLDQRDRLLEGVAPGRIDLFGDLSVLLSVLGHVRNLRVEPLPDRDVRAAGAGRRGQSTISIPTERAVPSRLRMHASMEPALVSWIFILAISSSFARLSCPTLSLPGRAAPEPFFFSVCSPAAFLRRAEAGGV